MPILAFLHIAIAIYFAVHAVKTGRNTIWLFVLLSFPFLGSMVYLFAEFLPEKRHSRVVRNTGAALKALIDPKRALREAEHALEHLSTFCDERRQQAALPGRRPDAVLLGGSSPRFA